jgi:hypothetical protein
LLFIDNLKVSSSIAEHALGCRGGIRLCAYVRAR